MAVRSGEIQRQKQVQTLSPQQILVAELLEIPATELEKRFSVELEKNPALTDDVSASDNRSTDDSESDNDEHDGATADEREDSFAHSDFESDELADYRTEDDIPDYKLRDVSFTPASTNGEIPIPDTLSFFDILKEQVGTQAFSPREVEIAEYVIGSLDHDGLLRKPVEALATELELYQDLPTSNVEVEKILRIIQTFEPAGIAATSLQECLLIQLRRKPDTWLRNVGMTLVGRYWDDFINKRKDRIMQALKIEEDEYDELYASLARLNPRPGSALGEYQGRANQEVSPDFIVSASDDGGILLRLNDDFVPELHISREFAQMLNERQRNRRQLSTKDSEALTFMKSRLEAAQNFIAAVKQRRNTLMAVMQSIVDLQRPYFLDGNEDMLRPMILKDVAERAGLDISTVSRVKNSKYVQTDFGIFPLSHFFGYKYTSNGGEEISVRTIKNILKECVESEEKGHPLSDDRLADVLKEKGFPIARRTVAKYREMLGIPVARLRK
ncbi:MAG: RNA polymerase factor sigma-54 [Bacteroidales bacterium]|nr:RNA polymerase factor sigma-54 [Bacteroidales bacterium]